MTEDIFLFLRGMLIGFAIAVPIGPVGILCLRRAFSHGRIAAWFAGAGAALADACFGAAVVFGAVAVNYFLHAYSVPLKIFGGTFMLILGIRAWRMVSFSLPATGSESDMTASKVSGTTLFRDFSSTFLITITNPGTMLGVVGAFAALAPLDPLSGAYPIVAMIIGVLIGSLLWWGLLTELAMFIRKRITATAMVYFNRTSAILLIVFAFLAWLSLLFDF